VGFVRRPWHDRAVPEGEAEQKSLPTLEREGDLSRILTFGADIHDCVGANIARAKLEVGLAFLPRHVESIELGGEPDLQVASGIYGITGASPPGRALPASRSSGTRRSGFSPGPQEGICQHTRHFAKGLTFTDPAHQEALDQMRHERKDRRAKPRHPEVEIRPLVTYDQLIGA